MRVEVLRCQSGLNDRIIAHPHRQRFLRLQRDRILQLPFSDRASIVIQEVIIGKVDVKVTDVVDLKIFVGIGSADIVRIRHDFRQQQRRRISDRRIAGIDEDAVCLAAQLIDAVAHVYRICKRLGIQQIGRRDHRREDAVRIGHRIRLRRICALHIRIRYDAVQLPLCADHQ